MLMFTTASGTAYALPVKSFFRAASMTAREYIKPSSGETSLSFTQAGRSPCVPEPSRDVASPRDRVSYRALFLLFSSLITGEDKEKEKRPWR